MADCMSNGGPEDIIRYRESLRKELEACLPKKAVTEFLNKAYPIK